MALNGLALSQVMVNATKNQTTKAMDNWYKEVFKYIQDNTEFYFSWKGARPSSPPQIIPQQKGIIISLTPPKGVRPQNLQQWGLIIQSHLAKGMVNIPGWGTAPIPIAIGTPCKITFSKKASQKDAQLHVAKEIIKWITAWKIPSPIAGPSTGGYVGSGSNILIK